MSTHRIIVGDCVEALRGLADGAAQCCVTSPPYWNLRRYGDDPAELGQEATPEAYIARLVGIFGEVKRTLRDDGTLWVNIGDSYNAYNGNRGPAAGLNKNYHDEMPALPKGHGLSCKALKNKDLIGVPWMLAFALRADGWYLRGDHIWGKPNGMPESVEDRPTRGHEYVFLLSKSERYTYDHEAVRTAPKASTITRLAQDVAGQAGSVRANGGAKTNGAMKAVAKSTLTGAAYGRAFLGDAIPEKERRTLPDKQRGHSRRHAGFNDRWDAVERDAQMADGANLRSIWWIPPAQFAEAHFAVMPDRVAEICVRAGCPVGETVLDPFCGSGVVGAVACRLGRNFIGCELYPEYAEMTERRIGKAVSPATFRDARAIDSPLFTKESA